MILKTINLTKKIKNNLIVNNLNLEIESNMVFGLIGPNGAGKTTTIDMLSSLTKPTSGDIQICGIDLLKNSNDAKKLIGLLPHETSFYMNKNAVEHLIFYGRLSGIPKNDIKEKCVSLLNLVGMKENMYKPVDTLSNGMKKQLGIAQALIHAPKILLLDEPFSGLDPQAKVTIRKIIDKLRNTMTIIISSHELETMDKICKKVAIINKGQVVVQDLVSKLKLKKNQISIELIEVDDKLVKLLKKIKGVKKLTQLENRIQIEFLGKKDMMDTVNKLLYKNNVHPISISRGSNIEDIFIEHSGPA